MLTAGKAIQIERFALDRSTFVRDCYSFFHMFLDGLTTELSELELSDFKMLTASRSPTILFPITPRAPPAQLPSYMLMIRTSDFVSNKKTWFFDNEEGIELEQSMNSAVEHDDWLVLKACAELMSGGWTDPDQLRDFLRISFNLSKGNCLYKVIEELYLGVYTVHGRPGIRFALTRYLPYTKCWSEEFAHWWSDNRQTAETAFVEHVFKVAFEAVERGLYHWDIRPANLLFDENEKLFYILDWDSVWTIRGSQMFFQRSDAAGALTKDRLPHSASFNLLYLLQAELTLCEELIVKCIFKWDNISDVSKNTDALAEIFVFFQSTLPSRVLNATSGQHDIRRDYFVHLMKLLLRLVCLVI